MIRKLSVLGAMTLCACTLNLTATAATPVLDSVFDGNDLSGWIQKPAGSFIYNSTDKCIQVSGTARGFIYTTNKYSRYRVIYSVRQLNHLHWPCALFFGFNPSLDAMGAIQFQLPNNSAWDYRPGHNVDPHGEGLMTSYGKLANLEPSNVWYRCEILVDQTKGTADSAAAFQGAVATHIMKFADSTVTNVPCPFAFQSHQSNVHDEFKDVLIEVNPAYNGLVLVSLPSPTNLQATAVNTEIDLTWTTRSTTQTGFEIFHSTDNQTWTSVATIGATATSYADTGLAPNTKYYYRVSAITTNAISDYATDNATTGDAVNNFTGTFEIQNVASGLVLNNQGSLTNGSAITQWAIRTNNANLEWTFIATANGYYQLNSVKSGKDAVVKSASTAAGAGIIQWDFGTSGDDQWKPVQNSDGSYTFFNLKSGLVLGDPGASTSTSTQMDQETSNGGSNQKWQLLQQ